MDVVFTYGGVASSTPTRLNTMYSYVPPSEEHMAWRRTGTNVSFVLPTTDPQYKLEDLYVIVRMPVGLPQNPAATNETIVNVTATLVDRTAPSLYQTALH